MPHCFFPIFRHPRDTISLEGSCVVKQLVLLKAFWFSHLFSNRKELSDIHPSHQGARTACIPLSFFFSFCLFLMYTLNKSLLRKPDRKANQIKNTASASSQPQDFIPKKTSYIIPKPETSLKRARYYISLHSKHHFCIAFSSINNVICINKAKHLLQCKSCYWQNRQTQPRKHRREPRHGWV